MRKRARRRPKPAAHYSMTGKAGANIAHGLVMTVLMHYVPLTNNNCNFEFSKWCCVIILGCCFRQVEILLTILDFCYVQLQLKQALKTSSKKSYHGVDRCRTTHLPGGGAGFE